jgi:hypothetical protein
MAHDTLGTLPTTRKYAERLRTVRLGKYVARSPMVVLASETERERGKEG